MKILIIVIVEMYFLIKVYQAADMIKASKKTKHIGYTLYVIWMIIMGIILYFHPDFRR